MRALGVAVTGPERVLLGFVAAGLPIVTELMDPRDVEAVLEHADVIPSIVSVDPAGKLHFGRAEPGWTVLTADQLDGKLPQHLETADALIVRSAVQADAKLLAHAHKLRVIGRAGVGRST